MCHVLDCHAPAARAHAIDLGIAMQLTNIARDVLEDAEMDRRYIPGDWVNGAAPADIRKAALAPGSTPESGVHADVTAAVVRLLDMAETFYTSGARGYRYLPWRAHLSIAIAARVYRQIGVQLRATGCAWHDGRQVTSKSTKLRCSLAALASLGGRFGASAGQHDGRLHLALRGLPYVA